MKSATGGMQRADYALDPKVVGASTANLRQEYRYVMLPKRRVASTRVKGELTPAKISEALKLVSSGQANRAFGGAYGVKKMQPWGALTTEGTEVMSGGESINLQLWYTKGCFNALAEPAISVHEMQYGG